MRNTGILREIADKISRQHIRAAYLVPQPIEDVFGGVSGMIFVPVFLSGSLPRQIFGYLAQDRFRFPIALEFQRFRHWRISSFIS